MNMDKSWMQIDRFLPAYRQGIRNFIETASNHADGLGRIRCPCRKCKNREYKLVQDVHEELNSKGMWKSYTRWVHHGEDFEVLSDGDDDDDGNSVGDEVGLQDLLDDLQAPNNMPDLSDDEPSVDPYLNMGVENSEFDKLLNDSRQPLYPGCKFSKLEFLVKLLHLKTINRLSNKAFNMNLQLIKAVLHAKGESLPSSYYEAKTLMRKLGLGYTSIHACKNDCVLFWKDNKNLEYCPVCTSPRYKVLEGKGKKIPEKILRYFPLKSRLQRLFMSRMTAEDMRWLKVQACIYELFQFDG